MTGYYSMNKKSACIDFRTNLENSLEGHNQLVDSNERLISFNYQFSRGKFPVLHHNFRLNPRIGLFGMAGYYSMEQIEEYQKAIPTVAINYDQYDPKNIDVWDTYIPIDDEKQRALDAVLSARTPYLIESEKGQGKTLLIYTICKENNIALIEEQVGRGTRITDLFGSKEINRDGTLFNLGIFPKAIEVANHFGHACLYCDEGNTQDPEIQKLWNRICDGRKSVFVNGKNYKLNPNCKLSIVWTTNPVTYAGINSMPEDLRSRFIGDVWDYPSNEQIKNFFHPQ